MNPEQISFIELLAQIYPAEESRKTVAEFAGLNTSLIDMEGAPRDAWHTIFNAALDQDKIDQLLHIVERDFPGNDQLIAIDKEKIKEKTIFDFGNGKKLPKNRMIYFYVIAPLLLLTAIGFFLIRSGVLSKSKEGGGESSPIPESADPQVVQQAFETFLKKKRAFELEDSRALSFTNDGKDILLSLSISDSSFSYTNELGFENLYKTRLPYSKFPCTIDINSNHSLQEKDKIISVMPLGKNIINSARSSINNGCLLYYSKPVSFDVSITNNTLQTLNINEVELEVLESKPNNDVLLATSFDEPRVIKLGNSGYGKPKDLKLKLRLTGHKGKQLEQEYEFNQMAAHYKELKPENLLAQYRIPPLDTIKRKIHDSRFNILRNRSFRNSLAPYKVDSSGIFLDAELKVSYKGELPDGNKYTENLTFTGRYTHAEFLTTTLSLVTAPSGQIMPSASIPIELKGSDSSYVKRKSIAHRVVPNDIDRFIVHVYADRSSRHLFNMRVKFSNGDKVEIPNVMLNYFSSYNGS